MNDLTVAQKRIYDFYISFARQHERYPSLRESARDLKYASINSIRSHLKTLERKGLIRWSDRGTVELIGYKFIFTSCHQSDREIPEENGNGRTDTHVPLPQAWAHRN